MIMLALNNLIIRINNFCDTEESAAFGDDIFHRPGFTILSISLST
jgi:hypothetical protein